MREKGKGVRKGIKREEEKSKKVRKEEKKRNKSTPFIISKR